MSSTEMTLIQKFNTAKKVLSEKEFKKSGINKGQGYSYYELGDFIPTIIQMENENNFTNIISFPIDAKGEREITLTILDGSSTDSIVFSSPIADVKLPGGSAIQGLGAMHTYMRRYMYVLAYEISERDIVDKIEPKPPKGTNILSAVDVKRIQNEIELMIYPNKINGVRGEANHKLQEALQSFLKSNDMEKTSDIKNPMLWKYLRDYLVEATPSPFDDPK